MKKKINLFPFIIILLILFIYYLFRYKLNNYLEPFYGLGGIPKVACLPGCVQPFMSNDSCKPIQNSTSHVECPFTCNPSSITSNPKLNEIYKDKKYEICQKDSDCSTCYPYKIITKTNNNTNTNNNNNNNSNMNTDNTSSNPS